jgi:DNA-binding response OmpR family regulator
VSLSIKHSPFIGLIDDDCHSARLFMRMLAENGGPAVCHFGDGAIGLQGLTRVLEDPLAQWPDFLVIDLKDHSRATLEFVRSHHGWLRQKGVDIVVMVPPTDRAGRSSYLEAGAAAVFFRQPELDAYRWELDGIAEFWVRNERLDAVGM